MKAAYADPPYIGFSGYYKDHPDYAGEVDHQALIKQLDNEYETWALSCSVPSLGYLLSVAGEGVRVLSWVKTFAAYKRNVRVAYSWEPVIVRPGPRLEGSVPTRDFIFDEIVAEPITMKRNLVGAKPERFCYWLFNVLGLRPQDEFHDLFPGSGAVWNAWEKWCAEGGPKLKQSVNVKNELLNL